LFIGQLPIHERLRYNRYNNKLKEFHHGKSEVNGRNGNFSGYGAAAAKLV
jgi:hypothetical protein